MNSGVFIALISVLISLVALASSLSVIYAAKRKRDQQKLDDMLK